MDKPTTPKTKLKNDLRLTQHCSSLVSPITWQMINPCLTEMMKRMCSLILLVMSVAFTNGCVPLVLYGPRTYDIAEASAIVSPFKHVSIECQPSLRVSLGDSDPSKLKNLHFASGTMTNEDGVVTQLRLRREILENPNSFVMEFLKAGDLGDKLHFCVTVLSNGNSIVITFDVRIKSKVVWPKDSDYSG